MADNLLEETLFKSRHAGQHRNWALDVCFKMAYNNPLHGRPKDFLQFYLQQG
jgi:hypothetical protein